MAKFTTLKGFVLLISITTLFSCGSLNNEVSSSEVIAYNNSNIKIYDIDEKIPSGSELITSIEDKRSGNRDEDFYYKVFAKAKLEAQNVNGNIIKITKVRNDELRAYILRANVYKNENLDNIPDHTVSSTQATVYFYRPDNSTIGKLPVFKNDGEYVGELQNNDKFKYTTTDAGPTTFYLKRKEDNPAGVLTINLEIGKSYYVYGNYEPYRNMVKKNNWVLELRENDSGRILFLGTENKN